MEPFNVVLLPGGTLPAGLAYRGLVEALGSRVQPIVKDLELYETDAPPPGYSLDNEVDGVLRAAAEAGFDRFHIVGYSFGGLVALGTAARHPERVSGLGIFEFHPVRGLETSSEGGGWWGQMERMMTVPREEWGRASASMMLKPGAEPPPAPAGPAPPWMAKRAAAMPVIMRTEPRPADLEAMARYRGAVYLALGTLSNPAFESQARRLAQLMPQAEIEMYEGLHHLNPPHLADPARYAEALLRAWSDPTGSR